MEIVQPSLSAGEITPLLYGRVDMDIYRTGVKVAKNFIVGYHGGLKRRNGMRVIDKIYKGARFVPFEFSTEQTYIIVFENNNVARVMKDGAFIKDISITHPYSDDELAEITFTQSADVLTVFNKNITPHELRRYSETDWRMIEYKPKDGPFDSLNTNTAITMWAESATGQTRIKSLSPIFKWSHIGKRIKLESTPSGVTSTWVQRMEVVVGDKTYYNGKYYLAKVAVEKSGEKAQTGDRPPVHDSGNVWDGPNKVLPNDNVDAVIGILWEYLHNGTATAVVIDYRNNYEVLANIEGTLPDDIVGGNTLIHVWDFSNQTTNLHYPIRPDTNSYTDLIVTVNLRRLEYGREWVVKFNSKSDSEVTLVKPPSPQKPVTVSIMEYSRIRETYKWAFETWNDDNGYPRCATYYSQRLCTASSITLPQTMWTSVTNSFDSYRASKPTLADDGLRFDVNSVQVNEILHMAPLNALLLFTSGGIWSINQSTNEALSAEIPPSVRVQSYDGSADIRPIISGSTGLYVQSGGRKIKDIGFDFSSDAYIGTDLTIRATHLFDNRVITSWCLAKNPDSVVWVSFDDGGFAIFTYLREQQIWGWCSGETDGFVNQFESIREGVNDSVYVSVTRPNGSTYAELVRPHDRGDNLSQFYVDSGLTYDGRAKDGITITVTGSSFNYPDHVDITSSAPSFKAEDKDKIVRLYINNIGYDINLIKYVDTKTMIGVIETALPVELQSVPVTNWGLSATILSGLKHLNGKTVQVLADGAVVDSQIVSDGKITIDSPAIVVTVGLAYESLVETLDMDLGTYPQTSRLANKLISKVSVLTHSTATLKASGDGVKYYAHKSRNSYSPSQTPGGDEYLFEIDVDGKYSKSGTIYLKQDLPINAEILSIIPNLIQGK